MERRCWLEVLKPLWSTRYDAEGRILLSEAGLVIGEVPNCVVQTPPGEAEGKDRFKREIGKALQVRPADASGGEQFQHTRWEKPPGFSGLHGNGESRQHRPARERRERFAALHE